MRRYLVAALFLAFCPLLAPEQAPARAQAVPTSVAPAQAQEGPASRFIFTRTDTDLLDEANAVERQYEKKGLVLHDPSLQAYLDAVGRRVLGARPAPQYVEFKFKALRDSMVNAFALPNGTVYVTTGLLSLLENQAQLAGVLGHELAHVYNRHSYLENRSVRKKALTINILEITATFAPFAPGTGVGVRVFGEAVQVASQYNTVVLVASVYGYSRDMERQADIDGIAAMVAASYDPHAMARSFELLDEDSALEYEPVDSFYHDHSMLVERRAAALVFASANTPRQARTDDEKEYLAAVSPAICYNISADIQSRRARTAVARATRLTTAFPGDPRYQVLLADSYRALGAKTTTLSEDEFTHHGQAAHRKEYFKMTEQEEQRYLLEKPEGRAALHFNQAQAEKLYQAVIQSHPSYADAYRDLGFLYEDEARYADAATNYQHYLQLVASTSLDRYRIERRLAAVQKLQAPQPH